MALIPTIVRGGTKLRRITDIEGVRRLWKLVNYVYYQEHIKDNMEMWNRAQHKIPQAEEYYYIQQLIYIRHKKH